MYEQQLADNISHKTKKKPICARFWAQADSQGLPVTERSQNCPV